MTLRPAVLGGIGTAMVAASLLSGQMRGNGPTTTPAAPARSVAPAANTNTRTLHLPPGWGMTPGPASTVNNPGGVPRFPNSPGIQPLFPSNAPAKAAPRTRHNPPGGIIIVPAYIPVASYPNYILPPSYADQPQTQPQVEPVAQQEPQVIYMQQQAPPAQTVQQVPQQPDYPPTTVAYPYPTVTPAGPAPADVNYALLAFKDHSIYAATDYWLENNRLMYITNYGVKTSAALDQLDMDLTVKLNADSGMKFELHEKPKQ